MTKTETIKTVDELLELLPRQVHGIPDAAEFNAQRKAAEKHITEFFWQYQADLAALKKGDDYGYGRSDAEHAFAAQLEKFKTTCAALTKMRAEVMREPRPGNTFVPSMLKVGNLYLQPTSDAAREFNKKVVQFSEDHSRELKQNTRALVRAISSSEGSEDKQQQERNIALQIMRGSDVTFNIRFTALQIERNKLLITKQ